jgi:hypothetical protein
MRLALGVGYTHASASYATFSGTSVLFDMAFGGAITPNLVIFGEALWHVIPDPTVKYGQSSEWSGTAFNAFQFGPGISYYIMPENTVANHRVSRSGPGQAPDVIYAGELRIGFV